MSTPFICPLPQWKAIFRRGKQDTRKITHHRAGKESLARALANFSPSIWKTNWTQTVLCLRVENRIRPQSWKFCPEANSATEPKPVPIHDELSLSAERRSPVTVAQLVRDESFLHCRPVGLSYSVGRFSLSWISFFCQFFFVTLYVSHTGKIEYLLRHIWRWCMVLLATVIRTIYYIFSSPCQIFPALPQPIPSDPFLAVAVHLKWFILPIWPHCYRRGQIAVVWARQWAERILKTARKYVILC